MKTGVAAGIDRIDSVEKAGYDTIELTVSGISKMTEEELAKLKSNLSKRKIELISCNVLMSGDVKKLHEDENLISSHEYLEGVMPKLRELGVNTVVFGSGGFRRMPENLSRERVFELVSCFLVLLEGIARENSITVVIEPLNLSETNIINTTEEAMEYISALSLPNLCLLVDLYHFYRENEPMERVYEYGKYIKHVHIAEPTKRGFMTLQDEYNYTPFFKALRDIEYKGSIVFEGGGGDFDEGIANALKVLKYGKKIIVE